MIRDENKLAEGLVVSKVLKDSIAAEMEIEPGDTILQINDWKIEDILDLQYYTSDEEFSLLVQKANGEIWELQISKDPDETLGIEVCSVSAGGVKKCVNNCVFCFVQQMPPGMRESLYLKDDDYRLSVTQGSYITLSNLSQKDFRRIIDYHINPLYISVHAWDPQARIKLMRNKRVGKIADQIKLLADAGLTLHTQIVVVPGYNDGPVLEETVNKLAAFYPAVQSIGVVPVGLTKYRNKLPPLRTITPKEAQHILALGLTWQKEFRARTGKNLVYFSDELYVVSGWNFPDVQEYDDFPQIENGIGMAAKFYAEFSSWLPQLPSKIPTRTVHIVTGVSAAGIFKSWVKDLDFIQGLNVVIHEIKNNFFGPTVTVAGLLTAQDIAAQVNDLQGDYFLIPKVMLKADDEVFLDDRSVSWLEKRINGKALVVENNGKAFIEGVLGMKLEVKDNE